MTSAMIKFDAVTKRYGALTVLDRLDLEVQEGEIVSIIGPSGSGKTTVLRTLMTLEPISDGVIHIDGEMLTHERRKGALIPARPAHLRRVRRKIGMVFQTFNLFPHMTALGNCVEAPIHSLRLPRAEAKERAAALLSQVGLEDKLDHYPSQLSGGQQQRVAIARALAMQPKILLLDEITSALDPETVGEVLAVVRRLATEERYTMLMVTHQIGFAREISDRICFFYEGRILEHGPAEELVSAPQHERTRRFIRAVREGI